MISVTRGSEANSAIGGRSGGRRFGFALVLSSAVAMANAAFAASGNAQSAPIIFVSEDAGIYSVAATFDVPQPPSIAVAVLTDYEEIPRFMPDVKTSVVRERAPGRVVVEQEAVASLMMFSRRIHLLLEVREEADTLRFRDVSGRSFTRYDGAWRITRREDGRTVVHYELNAKPAFPVPDFLLRRLLGRDAREMIDRLRGEIAARTPVTTEAQIRR